MPQALPIHGVHPSWAVVLLGISTFVAQYAASGICEAPLVGQTFGPVPCLDLLLLSTALLQWYLFDRSPQGENPSQAAHIVKCVASSGIL